VSDPPTRVLLVEDDEDDYQLTRRLLSDSRRATFELKWVRNYDAAMEALTAPFDVCLVDYRLGGQSGLEVLAAARARGIQVPMILLTGRGDHEVDVEAMKAGAADYLVKGEITSPLMERVIRHSMEREKAKAAQLVSDEHLRQVQKMDAIGSLAGGVAHDFNNLLSVIVSYSELLLMDLRPGDPMRENLEEIGSAGNRAAELTRQLLVFSRRQILAPKVVSLNVIFAGLEKMLRRLIGEDVELAAVAAPTLGRVLLDPGQMEQVIMNLVVNARDAMPGGGKLTIETSDIVVSAREAAQHFGIVPGPHVMLTVTDTGPGMDAATQARMFEPFFTTKEVGKGSGLGLATVFGIVQQSGGAISVQSELGKGTTFKTFFPLVAPGSDERAATPPSRPPERRTLRGSETILVVEDDERVRILACTILRRFGYQILEAQSGGDALIVCEQHKAPIDLLLSDVVMPRVSGPQLAARLRAGRPDMKVLFMSGYTDDAQVQHGVEAALVMQKPIRPETLTRRVREVLGVRRDSLASGAPLASGARAPRPTPVPRIS
jgi:two-component system, cell cycle sensor histidine kinase and response regulator CckA